MLCTESTTEQNLHWRPQARRQLKQAGQLLPAERRAIQARRREERLFAQQVRRQAMEQAALERQLARRDRAVRAKIAARRDRPGARGGFAIFLDEQDLRRPPTRADVYRQHDAKPAASSPAAEGSRR